MISIFPDVTSTRFNNRILQSYLGIRRHTKTTLAVGVWDVCLYIWLDDKPDLAIKFGRTFYFSPERSIVALLVDVQKFVAIAID